MDHDEALARRLFEYFQRSPNSPLKELICYLCINGLEDYSNEIVANIFSFNYNQVHDTWRTDDVYHWISQLQFLHDSRWHLAERISIECIDGQCLFLMKENDWREQFTVSAAHALALCTIICGWTEWRNYQGELPIIPKRYSLKMILGSKNFNNDVLNMKTFEAKGKSTSH